MDTTIQAAYSPELFRSTAHSIVDILADYLDAAQNKRNEKTIPYQKPEEALAFWQADFEKDNHDVIDFFKTTIQKSTHLHDPRYMGHQVTAPLPITAISSIITSLLNNGMAVYEMGLVSNPLERIIAELLAKKIGFGSDASGLLTSGGTLANLTALLTARAAATNVWEQGTTQKLAILVSEEAHYCVDRAARIMGMGDEGIIKIPVNDNYQMRTSLLETYLQEATSKGFKVIAVIGSACSTSTGSYDDLEAIGLFARQHNIWFHVDGAHGAAVIFSEKYKHLVKGIAQADSVIIDWHKMLMVPALATSLIYKKNEDAFKTFQQKAQYLWANQHSKDWYNSGKRTFECTKLMMSVKIYAVIKAHGQQIFSANIDYLHNLTKAFAKLLRANPKFELAIMPQSNIVCFRYLASGAANNNALNAAIREQLLVKGEFYIVQTSLNGNVFLRTSIMNPLTVLQDLENLLQQIEIIVQTLEIK
jgi:L-2,4-diaminobutyrate decarboxylase